MKVRILRDCHIAGELQRSGHVVEVDPDLGARLIAGEYATKVAKKPEKATRPAPETAAKRGK